MDDRAFMIHAAKVHLRECQLRRHSRVNRNFYWSLFAWAQRCRREAADARPPQGELFA